MFGRGIAAIALALAVPAIASSQTEYSAELRRDLPTGGSVFSLIESAQAEITTDRFNSGGLNAGVRDRASAFLASWRQTQYRIGDILVASPVDGTPMVFPELDWWEYVEVFTAKMPKASTATGLNIALTPRLARNKWTTTLEVLGSGARLTQSSSASKAPAITQLASSTHVSALASGYLKPGTLSLSAGVAFNEATTFERNGERRRDMESLFVSTEYTAPYPLRGLVLWQPDARHLQVFYMPGPHWEIFGGYTGRRRDSGAMPASRQVDRLIDGPVPSAIESAMTERRATAAARFYWAGAGQSLRVGVDADRSSASTEPIANTAVFERVDGTPARLWRFAGTGSRSQRHAISMEGFVNDRFTITKDVYVEAALRFQGASASASGAANGLAWHMLLPSVYLDWFPGDGWNLTTGVSRTADQPLLDLLAYGDPNAPTADVFRWDGENILPSPPIMRVGPGTGGDAAFSSIDPKLTSPVTDQFLLELEWKPSRSIQYRVTGLARRQQSLIGVVNIGVPASGYTMFTIPDANADWVNPADDQQLQVFERKRETFGQDRYRLTNPEVEAATMGALVLSAEITQPRVIFRISGTASASVGSGGNRGYTAIENDQSMIGELFTNPNAMTNARGRLFNDRAYTIKALSIVELPFRVKAGVIARFQDGQPFTRLAIVPNLNQGAEAIQTFPRGRSRFSYRATLDLRLQKRFGRTDLIADAYNLLNASSEVEEYVVTGPRFREITAVQPPRAFHLGARLTF
jgi:hypothetical protein